MSDYFSYLVLNLLIYDIHLIYLTVDVISYQIKIYTSFKVNYNLGKLIRREIIFVYIHYIQET